MGILAVIMCTTLIGVEAMIGKILIPIQCAAPVVVEIAKRDG